MEFRQLRYFVVVAEERNIGAAAQRLHVSQPPISRQIKALEEELGVVLFLRTSRGVELTAAGEAFLEEASRILADASRAGERSRAAATGEYGQLEVAYFGSAIFQIVPSLLKAFTKQVPEATISLTRLNTQRQIDAVREGRIHVGFSRYYPRDPSVQIERIVDEPLLLASTADENAPREGPVPLSALEGHPIILFPRENRPSIADEVILLLKRAGIEPQVTHITDDVTSGLALTAIGAGSCLVPQSVAAIPWPGVQFNPLAACEITAPLNCAYRHTDAAPILSRFLAAMRDYLATSGID